MADEYEFTAHIDLDIDNMEVDCNRAADAPNADENFRNNQQPRIHYESDPDDFDDDNEMPFQVEPDNDPNDNLPQYSIDNKQFETSDQDTIVGWVREQNDSGSSLGPFLEQSSTIIDLTNPVPELFFNQLFDDRMWTVISDATNHYAQSKCNTPQGNRCTDPTHAEYLKHRRLNVWTDITPSDLKMFIAHNILMGIVQKSDLEKYWSQSPMTRVPFFGKYMSRNKFQSILWNLHIADDSHNPKFGQPGHDPLAKLRPFVSMLENNFCHMYRPEQNLAVDEACCPFKGRLRFRVYNPSKPNRFHIKLFQISESESGYIIGFEVYTGKDHSVANQAHTMDPNCTRTTTLVIGLLEKCNLLDRGHCLYMDNYYSSPELFEELYFRETYSCGTARTNRKGMPNSLTKLNVQPLESAYLRNGPLLCLKWKGAKTKTKKKPVTLLSTIHDADEILTVKKDSHGNRIPKPQVIVEYTRNMSGVDLSDQYMAFHMSLRKSYKWWRKLFFHMCNMLLLNSYILNKKYGSSKMSHEEYMEYIAKYLIETSIEGCTCIPSRAVRPNIQSTCLIEKHFIRKIPRDPTKKSKPNPICKGCNFTRNEMARRGFEPRDLPRKTTTYWCSECEVPLCVTPCFEVYHTSDDY